MKQAIMMHDYHHGNLVLSCPVCKESYLHHHKIKILERFHDSHHSDGIQTIIDQRATTVKPISENQSYKIPGRRDVVLIYFTCEQCHSPSFKDDDKSITDNLYVLAIIQHKGQTFIEWVDEDEDGKIIDW